VTAHSTDVVGVARVEPRFSRFDAMRGKITFSVIVALKKQGPTTKSTRRPPRSQQQLQHFPTDASDAVDRNGTRNRPLRTA
jgi:hypothetical protein